jgi:hypothetical protein
MIASVPKGKGPVPDVDGGVLLPFVLKAPLHHDRITVGGKPDSGAERQSALVPEDLPEHAVGVGKSLLPGIG